MVKLTACVITKNEEKNIVQWLECMRKITKDMVVVDTGSTDKTVQVAESLGAKVYFFPWNKDFAAAKNFAIEQACGEWIIFLDADEYFTNDSIKNVRKYIERFHRDRKIDALVCKIINVDATQNQRYISEFFNLRIFRNQPMLRYKYPIHETMERRNGPLGFFIIPSGVEIYHSGYSSDIVKGKLERNLKILQDEIAKIGEKPWHYRYLCECYFGLGDYEKSYHYACLHVEKGERSLGRDNSIHKRLLETMILLQKPEAEVMAEIDKMVGEFPEDSEMLWYKGEYSFQKKYYKESEAILREVVSLCENMPENSSDYGYTSLKARWGAIYYALGSISEYKGNLAAALADYQAGLGKSKYNEGILVAIIKLSKKMAIFDLSALLKNFYKENQTDVSFVLRVLRKFPGLPAYSYYLKAAAKFSSERDAVIEIHEAIAGGAYDLAARQLKMELERDYQELLLCALRQPSLADGTFKTLLPPLYQAAYRHLCAEEGTLAPSSLQVVKTIKQVLDKSQIQQDDTAIIVADIAEDNYALCRRYVETKEYMQALKIAGAILESDPDNGDILYIVACSSYQLEDFILAEKAARTALQNGTKYDAETYKLLGLVYYKNAEYLKVLVSFTQALECVKGMKNDFSASLAQGLGCVYRLLGDSEKAKAYYLLAHEWCTDKKEKLENYSSYLLCCHYNLTMSAEEIFSAHKQYHNLLKEIQPYCRHDKCGKKIRIGYLSADFRKHVLFNFYYTLLAHYDKEFFTVICYSLGEVDHITDQLRSLPDVWRNLAGKSYAKSAEIIYGDAIDILVDLGGHSANSGLPILAFRPAPVQMSGLGYFNTTGLDAVDYLITDVHVDLAGENDIYFTEKLLRLPHSQFCYVQNDDLPVSTCSPCAHKGFITFGCFNQYAKITDEMLTVWRRILDHVPNSILVLKTQVFVCADGKKMAMERLQEKGFDVNRVKLEATTPDYMECYLTIDIALDTYPYPGGGTTCDALYMGVPVITMEGERHGTRFGCSILKNVGLEALVAGSEQEYIERAVGLAGDKELLDILHRNLRTMMQKSRLMDQKKYMDDIEMAYQELVKK